MARPTEWRRFVGEYVEGASIANQHFYQMGSLAVGETLTRVRFTYQAAHVARFVGDASLFLLPAGIIVVPAGTSTAAMPYPWTNPNADWLWWNASPFMPYSIQFSETSLQELDLVPLVPHEIDVKAMRKADPIGSDIWFQTQTTDLNFPQDDHFLSVSGSMLVTLP